MTQKLHPIVIISPQIETIIPEETTHLLTNNNSSLEEKQLNSQNNDSIVSQNSIENTTTKNNKKHRKQVYKTTNSKSLTINQITDDQQNDNLRQSNNISQMSSNMNDSPDSNHQNHQQQVINNSTQQQQSSNGVQRVNNKKKFVSQDIVLESANMKIIQVFPKQHKNEFKTQQKFFNRRHRLDQPHPSLQKSNGFRYIIDPANQLNNPTQTILSTLQSPQSRNFSQQNTNFLQNYTQVINNNTLNNDSKQIPCSQTTNNFHKVNSSIVSNEDFNEHILVIDPRQQQNQSKFRTTGYYSIDYARNNTTNMLQTTLNVSQDVQSQNSLTKYITPMNDGRNKRKSQVSQILKSYLRLKINHQTLNNTISDQNDKLLINNNEKQNMFEQQELDLQKAISVVEDKFNQIDQKLKFKRYQRQKLLSQQKLQQLSQKETMGHEQEEILENYQKELKNLDQKIIQESPDDKQTSVILNKSLASRNKKARLFNQNQRLLMYKRQYFNERNSSLHQSKTENQQNSQQNPIILLPKLTIIKPEQLQLSPQLKDLNNQPQKISKNSDMPSQRELVNENQIDQREQVSRLSHFNNTLSDLQKDNLYQQRLNSTKNVNQRAKPIKIVKQTLKSNILDTTSNLLNQDINQVYRDRNQISIKQYKKDMSEFLNIKQDCTPREKQAKQFSSFYVNQNQRGTETLPQEKSQISNLNPASITDEKYQNDTKRTNSKIRESSLSQQKQHPIQKQNFEVQIKTKYNEKFADLSFMAQQQKKDSNFQSKRQSYDFDFKKLKTQNKSFENQRLKALLNNASTFNPTIAQNNKIINSEHQFNSFSDNIPSKPLAVQEYIFMPQQFYQTSIVEKIPKFLLKNREQNLRQFMNVLRVSHPELARDIKIRGDRR